MMAVTAYSLSQLISILQKYNKRSQTHGITYNYSLTRSAAHILLLINSRLWTKTVHKYTPF